MQQKAKSLLVVGVDAEVFARFPPLLWRASFDVSKPASAELAMHAIAERRFNLIVTAYPLEDLEYQGFLDEVRAFGSPCRSSSLLAITGPEHLDEASSYVGKGLNKAVSHEDSDAQLAATIADLLAIAPRAAVRADVTLRVRIGVRERSILTQTVNISRSGMLVRAAGAMKTGEEVTFSFTVPDPKGTVSGRAEVVRIADGGVGRPSGTGMRFVEIDGDEVRTLERFLVNMMLS